MIGDDQTFGADLAQPGQFGAGIAPATMAPLPPAIEVPAAPTYQVASTDTPAPPREAAPSAWDINSYHRTVGHIESSGGTMYGNGGGIYQFIPSTAKSLGYTQEQIRAMTPEQQTALNDRFTKQNIAPLVSAKLPVNDVTAYMAHQQGGGGAVKLLTADPNATAADIVGTKNAAGNKAFFYNTDGTPKTVAQSIATFQQRVAAASGSKTAAVVAPADGPPSPQPAAAAPPQQPQSIRDRMRAWLDSPEPDKPQAEAAPAEPEQPQRTPQIIPAGPAVSGVVRQGGKVYFQRYGRMYDATGKAVG